MKKVTPEEFEREVKKAEYEIKKAEEKIEVLSWDLAFEKNMKKKIKLQKKLTRISNWLSSRKKKLNNYEKKYG